MTSVPTASRIRGSLYGVAIADALGGPVEFHRRGSFPPVIGYRYNRNFDLAPGTWTDDTSMTLCLAQSLVEQDGKFVIHDQISKYVQWKEYGYMSAIGRCFDIGNATRQALGIWQGSTKSKGDADATEVQRLQGIVNKALNRKVFCGNGSLMRCAPIPLVYYRDPSLAQRYATEASLPTHPHPTCQQACQIYAHLIARVLESPATTSKIELWDYLQRFDAAEGGGLGTSGNLGPALRDALGRYDSLDIFQQTKEDDIKSSGYVVHTLEAALWAFFTTSTFEEGALKVVNLGDDADTVGAVYGGLAGAWYGIEVIPEQWLNRLEAKSMVDEVIEGVVRLVGKGGYDGS